jgi:hypothetical protein
MAVPIYALISEPIWCRPRSIAALVLDMCTMISQHTPATAYRYRPPFEDRSTLFPIARILDIPSRWLRVNRHVTPPPSLDQHHNQITGSLIALSVAYMVDPEQVAADIRIGDVGANHDHPPALSMVSKSRTAKGD